MVDFTELHGCGDAYADRLSEEYNDFEELAVADPATVSDVIQAPEDRAAEFIVQAQDMAGDPNASDEDGADSDGTEGGSDDDKPSPDELSDVVEEADESGEGGGSGESDASGESSSSGENNTSGESSDSGENNTSDESADVATVTFTLATPRQYDALFDAVLEEVKTIRQTNRSNEATFESILAAIREASVGTEITVELEHSDINELHSTLNTARYDYQGDNMIDMMEAMDENLKELDEVRDEVLF